MCFWVSPGVLAWKPSVFSTRLAVLTETSVPVATKSRCGPFAVTQGFLPTSLPRNLAAAVGSFLLLPRPGTLDLRTTLLAVSLGAFSAFAVFLYPVPCLRRAMISSLASSDQSNPQPVQVFRVFQLRHTWFNSRSP